MFVTLNISRDTYVYIPINKVWRDELNSSDCLSVHAKTWVRTEISRHESIKIEIRNCNLIHGIKDWSNVHNKFNVYKYVSRQANKTSF